MPVPDPPPRCAGPASSAWPLWPLPLACALLLLLAVHVSFLLAAASGHLEWCFPYGLDCVSISATGRELPAKLIFKPALIIGATGILAYWILMARWLRLLGVAGVRPAAMAWLGGVGALCLISYAAALGEGGDTALVLRRLGAVLGFSLNYLAQLLLTAELRRAPARRPEWAGLCRLLWALIVGMLLLGLTSALLTPFSWHERIDDGIEWILALMLNLHLAGTGVIWCRSGYGGDCLLSWTSAE